MTGLRLSAVVALVVAAIALAIVASTTGADEASRTEKTLPTPTVTSPTVDPVDPVDAIKAEYREDGYDPTLSYADYDPAGDYLRYGENRTYAQGPTIRLDADGIPKVKYGDVFQYNPVTVSQFALTRHGQFVTGDPTARRPFLVAADKLVAMQGEDGAFRYDFEWTYYLSGETYRPGWVSGMAQGVAISALTRAFRTTGHEGYLEAAERAFDFLLVPIEEGGPASTLADLGEDGVFFEEYISDPGAFTLNGYMFTLLGLYDLAETTDSARVRAVFEDGVESLVKVLPLYDHDGFSAYDLGHVTFDATPHLVARYHAVHLFQLHALHSVTGVAELAHWKREWTDTWWPAPDGELLSP